MLDTAADERVNILLVDDQPARLLSYETILAELGQNLVCAHSGVEALERLMKDEYALVLLDVSMPGMDGFETAAMIHDHPRFEKTPIIFVTGVHDSEFDRLKGYKLGAVDYVSIPVVPEILRSKVSVLVELHLQRRTLQKLNRSLADANSTLQAEKTRELEQFNRHLQQANAELEQANSALQAEIAVRTRAEVALKEADRRKDEFLAILAHELRNPLAPIRNAVEIMGRLPMDNPQLKWSRDVIDRQAAHLTRLVDDLLDISRITRGIIRLASEPVQIGAVVARAIEALQPVIAEHGHELTIDCPEDGILVKGDATRLVQILGNLLNNAARYTNPGGKIALSVRCNDTHVELRVRDNGIGIPQESVNKLFHLFSRLEGSEQRTTGGLGIGLALVRKLVEMHGGEVTVFSKGANEGSEFTVKLPTITHVTQELPSSANAVQLESLAIAPRRVLIADDNQDALDTLALLLECDGHAVFKASDGAAAVKQAEECRPDLIFLDIGMPMLDGYEAAAEIRRQEWGRNVVLVALTGWGQRGDIEKSRAAGFDSHLVKPVSSENLSAILAQLEPSGSEFGNAKLA
ncbi:MAG TPA: response regulator [Steroidobacteraceae bacterium]|nr:response regulator [Steroidobacteraceae bacterium]